MPNSDPELRAAIAAYLRAWDKVADVPFPEMTEEGWDQLVEWQANDGGLAKMFRVFHSQLGRYPTF